MIYCNNGSLNMSINNKTGLFEILVISNLAKKRILKKTYFYKKACKICDKLAKKYYLK